MIISKISSKFHASYEKFTKNQSLFAIKGKVHFFKKKKKY